MTRTGSIIDRRNWNADECWFEQGMARTFWDVHTKTWILFRVDADRNQVGPAHFFPNSESLIAQQSILINKISSPQYDGSYDESTWHG